MSRPRKPINELAVDVGQRADGSWRARVPVARRADGKVLWKQAQRARHHDLVVAIADIERRREDGEFETMAGAAAAEGTVWHWFNYWVTVIAPMTASERTCKSYASSLRIHVLPRIGHIRLDRLSPADIEKLIMELRRTGSSEHHVVYVRTIVRTGLARAMDRGHIDRNVAAVVKVKVPRAKEIIPFTPEEAQAIVRVALTEPGGARWLVALSLGLRQGEALGLTWADIDLEHGVLTVRQTVRRDFFRHGCVSSQVMEPTCGRRSSECPKRKGSRNMAVSEPKTPSSRRTMVLPDPVRSALMQHRLDQRELRMKAGRRWKDNNLVFCTANGCLINAWVDRDNWHRLLKRAGVRKARLHDARHTAATLMMMQKIDTRVVMSLMGWTEFKTTQRYTHVVDELQRDAAVQMGKILFDDGEST